jgi:Lipase (class 3)
MGAPILPNGNPNFYPNIAMQLSAAAEEMPANLNPTLPADLKIVWGPAYLPEKGGDFTYSLAFVACNSTTKEYWVVIRGTNPYSIDSWFGEDFHINRMESFSKFIPKLDDGIKISKGSYTGMNDLLALKDPETKLPLLEFVQSENPAYLYITGHSLGGTLVPPLFAYLQHNISTSPVMACWSFAGLTTGNAAFADYINGIITWEGWRLVNALDVVPHLFSDKDGAHNIYNGDPRWTDWDLRLAYIDHLFNVAEKFGYTQPGGFVSMPGTLVPNMHFFDELLQQHAHQTYLTVVNNAFPNPD